MDEDFVQSNVRVPVWAKAEMSALGAMYRGEHYLTMAEDTDIDVVVEVADMPNPKLPRLVEFEDARRSPIPKVADYAERGFDMFMRYQRQVGIVQSTKYDSDEYIRACALAVAYGKIVQGLYMAMVAVIERKSGNE